MVMQVLPNVLGPVNDAYFRFVADVGVVGRDQGKGRKYLLVPRGHKGALPKEGYFVTQTPTDSNLLFSSSAPTCRLFLSMNRTRSGYWNDS
jgi:hypothetical protein